MSMIMTRFVNRKFLATLTLPMLLATTACDGFFEADNGQTAESAYAAGQFKEARIHLLSKLKADPSDKAAGIMLARTLLEMGDGLGAKARLETLVDDPKVGGEAKALMTHAMVSNGKHKDVIGATNDISGPHGAVLAWSRASSLFALDRADEAKQAIQQGLALQPGNVELMLLQASALLSEGNQQDAAAIAAKLTARDDPHPLALLFAGRITRLNGDELGARKLLERARQKRPEHPQILKVLGDSHRQTGDPDKARECYERALGLEMRNLETHVALAELEFFEGNNDRALKIVQANERGIQSIPEGLRLAGLLAEARGDHQSARAKLTRYLADHPAEPIATTALARTYDALGEPGLALEARKKIEAFEAGAGKLREGIRNASVNERAKIDLAEKAIAGQRWQEADGHYAALLANPNMQNPVVFNNAAMVKSRLGQNANALILAEKAYSLAPNDAFVQDSLAWTLFENGKDTKRAANLMTSAYESHPDNFEISWHFAQILSKVGRRDDAVQVMERLKSKVSADDRKQLDRLITQL
jgi:tetratricopeptide (TPR) repeat protein